MIRVKRVIRYTTVCGFSHCRGGISGARMLAANV